jgi:hypothetical protein
MEERVAIIVSGLGGCLLVALTLGGIRLFHAQTLEAAGIGAGIGCVINMTIQLVLLPRLSTAAAARRLAAPRKVYWQNRH